MGAKIEKIEYVFPNNKITNNDLKNDFEDYDLDRLSKDSFKYIKETTNLWNEIPSEFKKDNLNSDEFKKWNIT